MRALVICLCLFAASLSSAPAQIIFIEKTSAPTRTQQQLQAAANFYGLTMESVDPRRSWKEYSAQNAIGKIIPLAVVIDAESLAMIDRTMLLASLKGNAAHIPILIAGINEQTSPALLKQWSAGAITGCQRSRPEETSSWYSVAGGNDVTQQLGGSRLPLAASNIPYLFLQNGLGMQWLIKSGLDTAGMPIFARTTAGVHDVFFATEIHSPDIPATPDPYRQQTVFASLAPALLFLHYAAGEQAWHSPGNYANFTIDDLWLREPYGHVNYEELLEQAQLHNFHTTIAFIPWNFDRSQPKVVSLFREHPDRLSICVHGNNHVHQEFGPLDTHPLQKQAEDMRQGLARMDRFTELTKIPYDAVMVFPHSIAPEATFSELRQSNYLATVNSLNVPSDAITPAGADFALRTATQHFGDFPSLRRYSAETDIPQAQLAIDAFLGNPMLFYAHESFFASGIDAFDKTADTVNRLQPTTQWTSLGDIAHHLYLEKLRDDGNYDIRAFSSAIQIINTHQRDAVFFIEKEEDFSQPITLFLGDKSYPFERSGSMLCLRLVIPKGKNSEIRIRYGANFTPAAVEIARNSFRVNAIRLLSDFRDNVVSNTELGRRFIRSYADNGREWNLTMLALLGLIVLGIAFLFVRRFKRAFILGSQILPSSSPR